MCGEQCGVAVGATVHLGAGSAAHSVGFGEHWGNFLKCPPPSLISLGAWTPCHHPLGLAHT